LTATQVFVLAIAAAAAWLAAASRFAGTELCPRWLERFVLGERRK